MRHLAGDKGIGTDELSQQQGQLVGTPASLPTPKRGYRLVAMLRQLLSSR